MSDRGKARRSQRITKRIPTNSVGTSEVPESPTDPAFLSEASNSSTASMPSTPRPSTPSTYSQNTFSPSRLPGSPSKAAGFLKLDAILKKQQDKENIENSAIAVQMLASLSSGTGPHTSLLVPKIQERFSSKELGEEASLAAASASSHITIRRMEVPRRSTRASKSTQVYKF